METLSGREPVNVYGLSAEDGLKERTDVLGLIIAILRIYELIIIVRALLSWLGIDTGHPLLGFIVDVTEPVLSRIRPWTVDGNLDLSPLVVIVVIQIVISYLG